MLMGGFFAVPIGDSFDANMHLLFVHFKNTAYRSGAGFGLK